MREALFIKKNAAKWKEFQEQKTDDPDELADRFVTLVDDLAYARTFYPKSKVTTWINGITANIYQNIYKNKVEKRNRFFDFFKYELPLLFYKHQKTLLFTFVLFVSFVAIGVYSSKSNPEFVRGVLGDDYVSMTEQNIENGDPFGVYKDDDKFTMFMRIAINNIRVSFLCFLGGFTLGLFTLKAMWSNGIMLGCFQQMFFAKGLGIKSILVIWIHGTLEISAIVLACVAGFVLAKGILFPKTHTRMHSFKANAKDAAKILITLIPILTVAAFFESYVTYLMSAGFDTEQNRSIPVWFSVLILSVSAIFIIYYFVILPIRLHKKGYVVKEKGVIERLGRIHA